MNNKNLLIVEDDYFMRTSLCGYLSYKGYNVHSAGHAAKAMTLFEKYSFDVAVVDIVIPEDDQREKGDTKESVGLELAKQFKQEEPDLGIVILSAHDDRKEKVLELFRPAMNGIIYQIKGSSDPSRLEEGIRMAMSGYTWIDPAAQITQVSQFLLELSSPAERPILEFALEQLDSLTPREQDVLEKISQARTVKRVANELMVVPGTVEAHINRIYSKLFNNLAKEAALREAILLTKVALIDRAQRMER